MADTDPPADSATTRPESDPDLELVALLDRLWTPPADPTGRAVGRFRLVRVLGRGGLGVVYLADDPALGRPVALKVPRFDVFLGPEVRSRFVTEARAAAGLDHPNVVPVYEAGEADGVAYIAAAYCPGENLAEWLARTGPADPRTAARIVRPLAEAVGYMHGKGVIHRDLKPANVLLAPKGGPADGGLPFVPRITDFGLARLAEAPLSLTSTSAVLGTPLYMAPEQAAGKLGTVGPAADVWALGAILYELLTGRPPFPGEVVIEVLDKVRQEEGRPPSWAAPGVPRELDAVVLKCLRKDPADRYGSADELAADLGRFLAGEPVRAKPAGVRERIRAWSRKPQRMWDAGVYALLVNAVLTAWVAGAMTYFWATGQRDMFRSQLPGNLAIVTGINLPLLWAGRAALRRSGTGLRVGQGVSALALALAVAGLVGVPGMFEDAYHDPVRRFAIFSMFALLYAVQTLLFAAGLRAYRASR